MEVRVVRYKVAHYQHTGSMKGQKVKIPAVWGLSKRLPTAFQKDENIALIFRGLSPLFRLG
jgi:hypothetical protein